MKTGKLVLAVVFVLVLVTGCHKPQKAETPEYDKPLPPGQLALRKITNPDDIPDFTMACYNVLDLRTAVDNSLMYLSKPSSRRFYPYGDISHEHVVASLQAFGKLLDSGLTGKSLNEAIREQFDVYISVGCDDRGTVLFTGYYTPIFDGSATESGQFHCPLYSMPDDLVKDADGKILGRRQGGENGTITPYPARSEIESSGMLQGKEMMWLSDPFEVYIAHVQGSAKIRTPDGKLVTVGYAANNGHDYQSIAQELVKAGVIAKEQLSLSAMIDYFRNNPSEISKYVNKNPRFVFFRVAEGEPRGSINVPVIPMRSIATDKTIFPRASLAFISTSMPRAVGDRIIKGHYTSFVLDQDTGGAIRAPGRCDVYVGQGDQAGKLAGQTYNEGRLYYLFLK